MWCANLLPPLDLPISIRLVKKGLPVPNHWALIKPRGDIEDESVTLSLTMPEEEGRVRLSDRNGPLHALYTRGTRVIGCRLKNGG